MTTKTTSSRMPLLSACSLLLLLYDAVHEAVHVHAHIYSTTRIYTSRGYYLRAATIIFLRIWKCGFYSRVATNQERRLIERIRYVLSH